MARHPFGGGLSDWAIVPDTSGLAVLTAGASITLWNMPTGGTRYTDLTNAASGAIDTVVSSDGTDGLMLGQIPQFYGPDGVWVMWAAINDPGDGSAVRQQICSTDIGAQVDAQASNAATLQSSISDFNAKLGAANGIATLGEDGMLNENQRPAFTLADADDVDVSGVADGDVLAYNATTSKWEPTPAGALPNWTDITTFASGVIAYQVQPAYRFLLADTVQLVGRFSKTSGGFASGATLCTLPAEARPTSPKFLVASANLVSGKADYTQLRIDTNGNVTVQWAASSYAPTWCGIDAVVYDLGGDTV